MTASKTILGAFALCAAVSLLAACEPEVGSPEWCEQMQDQPTGEWTVNQASAFAKHCVLGQPPKSD